MQLGYRLQPDCKAGAWRCRQVGEIVFNRPLNSICQAENKRCRHGAAMSSKTQLSPTGLAEYLYPFPVASSMVSKPSPVAGAVPWMISHLAPSVYIRQANHA